MFLQHETPTTFGKLSTDKNSILSSKTIKPLFRALKYILSPCNKTLLNVVFDQSISGIFSAVKIAHKLMKAHCLPLDWALKKSSPWCTYAERNKAVPTWFFWISSIVCRSFLKPWLLVLFSKKTCVRNRKTFSTSPLKIIKVLEANYFPGNSKSWQTDRHKIEISTIHRSRERLGRVDSGETTAC